MPPGENTTDVTGGIFGKVAYWNGRIYVAAIDDVLRAYSISNAVISTTPLTAGDTFGFPGATPAVSSQGTSNGIVWVLDTNANGTTTGNSTSSGPAVLYAYDGTNLNKLFSSPTSGASAAGNAVKFTVPTVANGKVYVAGQSSISVFGLLP